MLPHFQPSRCARCHIGDRARLLHREGAQLGPALRRRVPADARAARVSAVERGPTMTKELFLEIGTEEIPAGFLPKAMADMNALIRKELETAYIGFGEVITMATPRRLVLVVKDLAAEQPTLHLKTLGPARSVAFDAEGKPTKAAIGFARSQGIEVHDLKVEETEKGPYVLAEKQVIGR